TRNTSLSSPNISVIVRMKASSTRLLSRPSIWRVLYCALFLWWLSKKKPVSRVGFPAMNSREPSVERA
ncbi:CpXC domain-containing protein, partial [Dysosmobacter welbionis]